MSRDIVYEKLIRPILFRGEPEAVHHLAQFAMRFMGPFLPLLPYAYKRDDLRQDFFGTEFSNPIGLAAGFDKNAELVPYLPGLGFGFAEIGSVCARPFGGNDQPRLFRLPQDSALINRLGLNGLGAEIVSLKLASLPEQSFPFGVNIAKTNDPNIKGAEAVKDIAYTFEKIQDNKRIKYLTINTSCPNTHEGCLKESEQLARVLDVISPAARSRRLPLFVKLSPDSEASFVEELVKLAISYQVSGFVCGNTSITRTGLQCDSKTLAQIGAGGLSGKPLKPLNLDLTRRVAALKTPEQIIIGVGGIMNGQDAFDYLSAGARFLQLYTGFVYRGPSTVKLICEELSQILKSRNTSLKQLQENVPVSS